MIRQLSSRLRKLEGTRKPNDFDHLSYEELLQRLEVADLKLAKHFDHLSPKQVLELERENSAEFPSILSALIFAGRRDAVLLNRARDLATRCDTVGFYFKHLFECTSGEASA